jgi:plastocyanin
MRRLLVAFVAVMVIPGVAWAGGGGVDTSGCAGYSEGHSISMRDSCFAGTAHFAPSGTTITVSNDGGFPHTLTAVDGSFDTGLVEAGATTDLVVDEPGIYRVFCSLHGTAQGEGMAGVLVVGETVPASVAAPAATSAISGEAQVITVSPDVDPVQMIVLLMVGLAAGLALSALLLVLRLRITDGSSRSLERLRPTVESEVEVRRLVGGPTQD